MRKVADLTKSVRTISVSLLSTEAGYTVRCKIAVADDENNNLVSFITQIPARYHAAGHRLAKALHLRLKAKLRKKPITKIVLLNYGIRYVQRTKPTIGIYRSLLRAADESDIRSRRKHWMDACERLLDMAEPARSSAMWKVMGIVLKDADPSMQRKIIDELQTLTLIKGNKNRAPRHVHAST